MKSKAKAGSKDSDIEPESEEEHDDQLPRFEPDNSSNPPLLVRKRSQTLDDDDYKPSLPTMSPLPQSVEGCRPKKKRRIIEPLPT